MSLYTPRRTPLTPLESSMELKRPPSFLRDHDDANIQKRNNQHYYVLPVLLLEFLALALTRAVLPSLLLNRFGDQVYVIMGGADFVRGILAFFACPVYGKLSDSVGRKLCLFVTVLGTCAPVCILGLFSWEQPQYNHNDNVLYEDTAVLASSSSVQDESAANDGMIPPTTPQEAFSTSHYSHHDHTHPWAITTFMILFCLSGLFSSTFTLVFAYISDTVRVCEERVSAYGLALATFGLSFTIGPMLGGYLAQTDRQYVFLCSLGLTVLDLLYIYFVLPESNLRSNDDDDDDDVQSITFSVANLGISWNPMDTLAVLSKDRFLKKIAKTAFLYYTGLWAVISTLSVYAVKRFHLSTERLGELMSVLGLSTMVAEAVLVRILVPILGEKTSIKVGLVSFALQCLVLGLSYESWHLFVCAGFSILGNLVYPSLSSLVSGSVEPDSVGEALGAINGIKALTEGFGPLVFGSLMTLSEKSPLPGWPYLVAGVLVLFAYQEANGLPDPEADDYIHELDRSVMHRRGDDPETENLLLSEVEESEDDGI